MKTLGIIGGMGPLATVDLMNKIINLTDANYDNEHIHIIVDCNTKIPDRTEAILYKGRNPVECMLKSAKMLENAGAQVLMIACNTAHYFYPDICRHINSEILHMPRETSIEISRLGIKKVGLLATNATIVSGIYQRELDEQKVECVTPSENGQEQIMDLIYNEIKKGSINVNILPLAIELERMSNEGADCFILGCTELPIAFKYLNIPFKSIDPTEILAKAAIRKAGYSVKVERSISI